MTAPLSADTQRSVKKMVSVFNRNNKLYVQYIAYSKTKQKSTRLEDTPENRKFIEKEIIPALERKILITAPTNILKPKMHTSPPHAEKS